MGFRLLRKITVLLKGDADPVTGSRSTAPIYALSHAATGYEPNTCPMNAGMGSGLVS